MNQYVALLRGINVGGKNIIKMTDLAACFQALGLEDVRTYIQSGNVLFKTGGQDEEQLSRAIETALAQMFHYDASLVLRSEKEMSEIVRGAPDGFGSDPEMYRYDVVFLRDPAMGAEAASELKPKEGVDWIWSAEGVLYFRRLIAKATQSRLTKITALPVYPYITIRNWNTTAKLLEMMKAADRKGH